MTTPETSAHAAHLLRYHLVFVTKYRRRVLDTVVLPDCEAALKDTAILIGARVLEINGEPDHVHLLVAAPPTISVAQLAHRLKGATSRHLRQEHGQRLRRKLWGDSLWTDSYFAATAGGATLDVIARYIQNQNRPR